MHFSLFWGATKKFHAYRSIEISVTKEGFLCWNVCCSIDKWLFFCTSKMGLMSNIITCLSSSLGNSCTHWVCPDFRFRSHTKNIHLAYPISRPLSCLSYNNNAQWHHYHLESLDYLKAFALLMAFWDFAKASLQSRWMQ